MTENASDSTPNIGRNEPCPCNSGKKYKRCCGVSAAPKLTPPSTPAGGGGLGALAGMGAGGFDPSQMDMAWMGQFSSMMQRLPKGQMQRLQGLMQKAMSGKEISREAEEFEKSLPLEMQELMRSFKMPGMPGGDAASPESTVIDAPQMSEEEARAIVEKAMKEGKVSEEQAQDLLKNAEPSEKPKSGGIGKLWKNMTKGGG